MHYRNRNKPNTDGVHCSNCGTRLNRGGYTICPACGNDNQIWLDNAAQWESALHESELNEKAKKAGFNSKAEHYIWKDKISKIEDYEKAKIKLIEKYIYPIVLAILSLISSICIIPNWWLIFQLILFVIIYLLLKFIIDDLIEPFDSIKYNIYKKYKDIMDDSSLLKDNNKLKNSIQKINKEEVVSESDFNLPNLSKGITKKTFEIDNNSINALENGQGKFNNQTKTIKVNNEEKNTENYQTKLYFRRLDGFYNIELSPKLNEESINKIKKGLVKIREQITSVQNGKYKTVKIKVSEDGSTIQSINSSNLNYVFDQLKGLGYKINKKKYTI